MGKKSRFISAGHLGDRPLPNVVAGCKDPDFHPAHCPCPPPYSCVFCEIIRTRKAEDFKSFGSVVSFVPLKPVVEGHRLFVPVRHGIDISFEPSAGASAFYFAAQWAKLKDRPFNLITSAGHAATQTILHTHIHYVPRGIDDGLKLPWSDQ